MGYNTTFDGEFTFDTPLDPELACYINDFSRVRHMVRDVRRIKSMDLEWRDHCWHGDLGPQGLYYIVPEDIPEHWCDDPWRWSLASTCEHMARLGLKPVNNPDGQVPDVSVLQQNVPPVGAPGLWCQWIVSEDLTKLRWDENEKFYSYREWLVFLVDRFIEPSGAVLSGRVTWHGDDCSDTGVMVLDRNKLVLSL